MCFFERAGEVLSVDERTEKFSVLPPADKLDYKF